MKDLRVEVREGFEKLANEFSPENLCCDGELSNGQVRVKIRALNKQWKALQAVAGRAVSLGEVEQYQIAEWQAKRGA